MKEILLFTGGLDSFILSYFVNHPQAMYFDLGHRYAWKEKQAVNDLCPGALYNRSFNLWTWERPDAFIPYRNLLLCMGAAAWGADRIYLGGVTDDRVNDNTASAHQHMTEVLSRYAERHIEVVAPFTAAGMSKFDAIRWYLRNGHAPAGLLHTVSCFDAEAHRCMACPACFRWWVALKWCGVEGVPEYLNLQHARSYVNLAETGEIEGERAQALIEMVKPWLDSQSPRSV